MTSSEKINLSQLRDKYKKGLRIPEIQRDYVMGAGGINNKDSKDKLIALLDAILKKYNENEDFDFSCIITFCQDDDTDNNYLDIYDGQQRLTTLVLLVLYRLQIEKKSFKEYRNWYYFSSRPIANGIIALLTDDEFNMEKIEVKDFTSFSMKNLLEKFSVAKYKNITSEYLLNHVKFDRVKIESQSEIEQFFMDLNSGVKLKDYELYKAKLVHRIGELTRRSTSKKILKVWPSKLDNEWLDVFKPFASFLHPAEEYEIAFIKYCFEMLIQQHEIKNTKDGISFINEELLVQCYRIMQSIIKLNFRMIEIENLPSGILIFPWGPEATAEVYKCHNYDKRGAFWNLDFEKYEMQLYFIIKEVLLDNSKHKELLNDILIWAYIKTLEWRIEWQNEYLRIVKILLNYNVCINEEAWYECQDKGQYMYYSKYTACYVPQYYGEHIKKKGNTDILQRHFDEICMMHEMVFKKIEFSYSLNKKEISHKIMDCILDIPHIVWIESIVKSRIEVIEKESDYDLLEEKENKNWKLNDINEKGYYVSKVNLSWPTRGYCSKYDKCWIVLQYKLDKMYETFNQGNNDVVKNFHNIFSANRLFDLNICFWTNSKYAYRIFNRSSNSAKTYAKKDSEKEYWAYRFCSDNTSQDKI